MCAFTASPIRNCKEKEEVQFSFMSSLKAYSLKPLAGGVLLVAAISRQAT